MLRFTLTRLIIAIVAFPLTIPAASAFQLESGGFTLPTVSTTTVVPTNVVAGIGNVGGQNVQGIANRGIGLRISPNGSVDTTVVVPTNVVAGIGNLGFQNTSGIANHHR